METQNEKPNLDDTYEHILQVQRNINVCVRELLDRSEKHDLSKLKSPEAELFHEHGPKLKQYKYPSPEYNESLKQLEPALKHHYAKNRHHPQHWKNGISDMNLIDLLEMFCDWKAATLRQNEGNIKKSIEANAERFNINPQLVKIFENTVELLEE